MYSISQYRRSSALSPALTAAAAVVLAAIILFAGTAAADAVKEKSGELVVAQVFYRETLPLSDAENHLLRRKTMGLLQQYTFAFIDAAIQFDTIPRMDSKVFLSIASAMPEDVTAEKIVFEGATIALYCSARQQNSPALFYQRLCAKTQFEAITFNPPVLHEGTWHFELRCTPHLAEGQLAMALPTYNVQPQR